MAYYNLSTSAAPTGRISIQDKSFCITIGSAVAFAGGGTSAQAVLYPIISIPFMFRFYEITQLQYWEKAYFQVDNGNPFLVDDPGLSIPFHGNTHFFGVGSNNFTGQTLPLAELFLNNVKYHQYISLALEHHNKFFTQDINFKGRSEEQNTFFSYYGIYQYQANAFVANLANYYLAYFSGIDAAVVAADIHSLWWEISFQGKILTEDEYYNGQPPAE